jgi:hypothetical protein
LEHSNDGEESGALIGLEHFSHGPHYIHDEMTDASPTIDLNHIHGCLPEDDVSIITDTKN